VVGHSPSGVASVMPFLQLFIDSENVNHHQAQHLRTKLLDLSSNGKMSASGARGMGSKS